MSISGKGCEKCSYTGRVPFDDDAPRSMMRPCGACAEPWGPQWRDAPDANGYWWAFGGALSPTSLIIMEVRIDDPGDGVPHWSAFVAGSEVKTFHHETCVRGTRWLPVVAPEPPR